MGVSHERLRKSWHRSGSVRMTGWKWKEKQGSRRSTSRGSGSIPSSPEWGIDQSPVSSQPQAAPHGAPHGLVFDVLRMCWRTRRSSLSTSAFPAGPSGVNWLIPLSPARDVKLPKIERREPEALTADQVMSLAEAMDPRYRALVLVGAFGGLRIGELAGLQLGDFDPLRNLIRVRRTAADVRGRVIVGPPKTSKSIRTLTLPRSITRGLLSTWRVRG